jgi:hypothetical protein
MDLLALEKYTPTKEEFLPIGIKEYAMRRYKEEMDCLNYPSLYVLPLSVEGEVELERLYNEEQIGHYGAYEKNFEYDNETFLAVIVNND